MKHFLFASVVLGMLLMSHDSVHAGPFGYKLDVTTAYDSFSGPNYSPSPDTSSITVTNNGTTTFTGTISDLAVAGSGPDFSQSFPGLTLCAGASFQFATSDESSNQGGFNGPTGSVQPGITLMINGLINGSEAVATFR